ncbi:MFS transporter [Bradyrhizobium sp. ISRA443]|uniref:MFS transporter n=1 Tax=unclassified Bradyrhizobium TaxID=2631580 RepID=UPI002479C085|nr:MULTISPECIES: MFS transporter [unclassified Bradyrhizobium]WGR90967.1 MFS transporter [Bradyrhizobium sp. ISRA435]WGS01109.1 MFS transporter [Bradyrhizobium sp. ISRA436]WGS07996.1 MFS transporter [Bradyrhizobium sp. ISRA437]WGS14884.1 MFS transporter [Bradyrhizobium sp. ISRA443]
MSQVVVQGLVDAPPAFRFERANVIRLAIAQALAGANSTVIYATGAVVGDMLAPAKALATLPISIFVVGMAACTLPAGAVAQRYGRRAAFMAGTGCGVLGGLIGTLAVLQASFWLFCVATFFGGVYAAVVLSFRFAAADCAAPERRPRALSAVMAGGVFAGVIGPQLVTYTMDLWQPYLFAATYLGQAAVAAVSLLVLAGVRLPLPAAAEAGNGRPLSVIARQPRFIGAVVCGVVSYLLMNFLMTAAPLAMKFCNLPQQAANLGLQWHVIAMYGPSFWTGRLISRFGASKVVATGLLLTAASSAVGLLGVQVAHFWATLILLGVGWNFGFVGASAMVLECHRPEEKARVQSLNDFVVFGTMTFGSFLSGGLLSAYGWDMVLWLSFPPLIFAVAALVLASAGPLRDDAA